jgi:hypothetical protein
MKKVIYALIAVVFLSCSGSTHNNVEEYPDILTPETISFLLSEKPEKVDPGLFLYRNRLTRSIVENFYIQVTADREIAQAILAAADTNDISLPLAFSLAWVESSYRIRALNRNSNSVDRGLFQLNSRTFPSLKEEHFYDPKINAEHGLAHLRYCLETGKNDVVALAMYNAGINRVRRGTPYSTLHYIARILDNERQLLVSFEQMLTDNGAIAKVLGPAAHTEDS